MSNQLLVTGATGFLGVALLKRLIAKDYSIRLAVRTIKKNSYNIEITKIGDIHSLTDWKQALNGINTVIHLAARVHIMQDLEADPLKEYRKVNVDGTRKLAQQAAESGVKRFIFVSSVKVNGEETLLGQPFTEATPSAPEDPYGISKSEAEEVLFEVSKNSGMEVVILRPPLIYGPGVKANFFNLLKIVKKGMPLPLGSIYNKRSLVFVDNVVDLLVTCIEHPAAANQVFMVSDGKDLSITELLKKMGGAIGKKVFLIPIPVSFINFLAILLGQQKVIHRLCSSLQVDISKASQLLNWKPPISVEEGLKKTVDESLVK